MNLPKTEEKILKFWEKNKVFEKSISQRKKGPYFSFYDGPPFATGKPHYGHILATAIKDTVLRYWTMKGYQVPRRVGWDCHGLPVENLIEKELGIKNKKEIEKIGIEKFNKACRASVFRCVKDFEKTLKRFGRWADYKTAYATLENDYIESVWWVLKQLWQRGLVYQDYSVSPYCPRCGTSLSNFEVNLGYKEAKDPSVFLKFKALQGFERKTYFLAWTTTPWTLPGNTALAVNPDAFYILARQGEEDYILAEKRKNVLKGDYKVVKKFKGKNLLGLQYEPLFGYLANQKIENIEKAFKILPGSFVSLEEGTGIVHTAVMYGADDFNLGKKFNLPKVHTVDESGCFKKEVLDFAGIFVKEADPKILENLEKRNLLYKKEEVLHSYPFCWRCDTPLLYYALAGWYIKVVAFKKELVLNNKKILWVPGYLKEGRFGKWLKGARDWNFSRNRFWGAPLPIWQCQECREKTCLGSIKELELLQEKKQKLSDLHRPYIDKVTLKCKKCKGSMKRVKEVFDCWFESGAMPYGQWHYPFENKKFVEKTFPADFIAEGLDQTRGWFYTLHVLASALTLENLGLGRNKPAFKNVIVNGLILDSEGRKLSKKLKNYPEPKEIFDSFGADSMRYFLLASTPIGEDYRFSSKGVEEVWRRVILTLLNSYLFFETYRPKNFKPKKGFVPSSPLNKWIFSRVQTLNKDLVFWMERYEITKAIRLFGDLVEESSNWYVRRARRHFQRPETEKEQEEFSQTLYWALLSLSKMAAPFMPFLSEEIYKRLTLKTKDKKLSVHLEDWPKLDKKLINKKLEKNMKLAREAVSMVLAERAKAGIKVRQPLAQVELPVDTKLPNDLIELIKEEVNVKKVSFGKKLKLDKKITPELKEEGIVREVIRQVQEMRKAFGLKPKDKITLEYEGTSFLNDILKRNEMVFLKDAKIEKIKKKEKETFDFEKMAKVEGQDLFLGIKKI